MNFFKYFKKKDFSDVDSLDTNSSLANSSFSYDSLDDNDETQYYYCCCFF